MTDEAKTVPVLLGEVQRELPAIGKDSQMQQGASYKYRGIDDILPVLNPLLSEKGLVCVLHEVKHVGDTVSRPTNKGGVMWNVRVETKYRWYGPLGDYVEAGGAGEGNDSGDKATQKAVTSAWKYMLVETFAISSEETNNADVDRHASSEQESALTPQQQRKAEFEKAGTALPEGWANFEEYDTAHVTYFEGMKSESAADRESMKAFREFNKIPWPMSKADMGRMLDNLATLKANPVEEFAPAEPTTEPEGEQQTT